MKPRQRGRRLISQSSRSCRRAFPGGDTNMTKLIYLAAMALLGLGLTMAQSGTPASDSSNSSQPNQAQNDKSTSNSGKPATHKRQQADESKEQRREQKLPDPTVQDQPNGTTSTTGAADENNSTPSLSTMGTTGSNPEPEKAPPANPTGEQPGGDSTDQQPTRRVLQARTT